VTPPAQQAKALAAAATVFAGTLVNVALAGAPVEQLVDAAIPLAQALAAAGITYLATFWIPNRAQQ